MLIGSALASSKIKNWVVNRTTLHSPARWLKHHSFDSSLHHVAKSLVFCDLQSYEASSQEGLLWIDFFPTTPKNTETNQNGLWRPLTWLAASFLQRILTASETDETLTQLTPSTQVYMCHAISFMTYDVSDLERFPISSEVMLSFFYPEYEFAFFDFYHL